MKNKIEMQFFYSIGPKIGTSVAPPFMKSTEQLMNGPFDDKI